MVNDFLESLADVDIFTDSLTKYGQNLSVSGVVMTILALFMLLGLVDKLRGNKLGYGERFDAGFQAKLSGGIFALLLAIFLINRKILHIE